MARYSAVVVLNLVESHADAFIGRPVQFPSERTDREPLGRPVARYSAVFVFYVVKKRKHRFSKIKFYAESFDRELLGRPVARYSTVFFVLLYKHL